MNGDSNAAEMCWPDEGPPLTIAEIRALKARAAEADARYEAERWAEKRLDLAAKFMAADINTSPSDRKYDLISGAKWSLDAADSLLARWKETTPAGGAGGSPVAGAMQALAAAMHADPDYAWGWHSNIAMAAVDSGATSEVGNEAARRFMKLAFGVDTKAPTAPADSEGGEV